MAKEKSSDDLIARGLQKLREAGLPLETEAGDVVKWLRAYVGNDQETNLAIVFLLGKTATDAAVDELRRIENSSADKHVKKEVRRSLFKLRQRGLKSAAQPEAEPRVVSLSETPEIQGFMSAVDGGGGRLIWIAKPQPGRGLYVIQGMVNDRAGLLRIGATQVRRKELRTMADEIRQQHGIAMIPVPAEYGDETLYHAYERAKAQGGGEIERFSEIRASVFTGRPKSQEHPVYRVLDANSVQDGAWREQSRRLLDEPEFRYWILDEDWLEPFFSHIEEAQGSRLVLNPVQKEERLSAIVRDAVKKISTGEPGKIMERRMEDMSLYLARTNRNDLAKLALAVVTYIAAADPGPLDVSFLTGLVQKTVAVYLSNQKSKAAEEPSLIVKP